MPRKKKYESHVDFSAAKKSPRKSNIPRGRIFKPGDVGNTVYLNREWGYDIYRFISEELVNMKDVTNELGDSTVELETQSREIRGLAKGLIERIDQATGHKGLAGFEDALDDGKIIQIPVTPKEQTFLTGIAVSLQLGEEAIQELSMRPAGGFY